MDLFALIYIAVCQFIKIFEGSSIAFFEEHGTGAYTDFPALKLRNIHTGDFPKDAVHYHLAVFFIT